MNSKVAYWDSLAQYDLETARVMLDGRRYLYVGFMCHQVIEKALKAHHVAHLESEPEYTHALVRLARKSQILEVVEVEFPGLLDTLEPLNIEARYPTQKDRLLASLNNERCETILARTRGLYQWLRQKYADLL